MSTRPAVAATTVVTFGTFDVFHVGHLRILERSRGFGAGLCCVVGVFVEESLEAKGSYLRDHAADVFVMGDDGQGRFDGYREICEVVYLPRTPAVSTTALIERIQHPADLAA